MVARWDNLKGRDRVRRQDREDKRAWSPYLAPVNPRRRKPRIPKAELRAQGQLALIEWQSRGGEQ